MLYEFCFRILILPKSAGKMNCFPKSAGKMNYFPKNVSYKHVLEFFFLLKVMKKQIIFRTFYQKKLLKEYDFFFLPFRKKALEKIFDFFPASLYVLSYSLVVT